MILKKKISNPQTPPIFPWNHGGPEIGPRVVLSYFVYLVCVYLRPERLKIIIISPV